MFKLTCKAALGGIKAEDGEYQCDRKWRHAGLHRVRKNGTEFSWDVTDSGQSRIWWGADAATISYSATEWHGGWEIQ